MSLRLFNFINLILLYNNKFLFFELIFRGKHAHTREKQIITRHFPISHILSLNTYIHLANHSNTLF